MAPANELPRLAAPARRALAAAGIEDLDDLAAHRSDGVAALHGMGPSAMERLRGALAEDGRSFADEAGD